MTINRARRRSAEAPLVLTTDPARSLSFWDQTAFWANLGVSLIGFTGAVYVLQPAGHPQLPIAGALLATVLGTLLGTGMVAAAGAVGARTGAPAMANFRGLFGTRLSYLPTLANIVQCVGWGVFELTVISGGVRVLTHDRVSHAVVILAAGALCTVMAIWPLSVLHILRKYVTVAVAISMLYFTVQLLRHPLPPVPGTSWSGFFPGVDTALAVAVSFVPLAADYTRHARSARAATGATMLGYSVAQTWCYLLGVVALIQVGGDPDRIFDTFLGVAAGWLFFAVLVLRESDQSFANVYSTAMSLQNFLPRVDRRLLAAGVGALATVLALGVRDFTGFSNFLLLIGSVFVPLCAVLVVDFCWGRGRFGWDLSESAPARPLMLLPWLLGFAVYQLFNPGSVEWWARLWTAVQNALGVHPGWWSSASLFAFAAAGLATGVLVVIERRIARD
ncbi:putative hydroxymethylpyrimidine transporter CytX [Nocardia transvalensis]|uniref:Putative hydroxymethylpyrimidine transporter CytX n=1 Tax=Nocardia transvalensis TaxID=37333 RepID=A0A7W9PAR4_9NOCA|nr:cytosine permease [Nocardia transvalensis]MBB5912652.1 putative hydroxymethylpyrimidine transporter CytX [Nocardia transvalensis]